MDNCSDCKGEGFLRDFDGSWKDDCSLCGGTGKSQNYRFILVKYKRFKDQRRVR